MFIDLHVVVNGDLSVRDEHAISHDVKDQLISKVAGVQDVLVPVEPG